jgi:hypothetical protein
MRTPMSLKRRTAGRTFSMKARLSGVSGSASSVSSRM